MSVTTPTPTPTASQSDIPEKTLMAGLALASFSALSLELALTRLFSVVFARESQRIPRLYGADLCGGALACIAVVLLLNWLGGPNTILFAAVTMAAAGAIWAESRKARQIAGFFVVALLALIAAND